MSKLSFFRSKKKKHIWLTSREGEKKEVGERLFIAATADRLQLITGLVLGMFHENLPQMGRQFIAEILIKPLL